MQEDEPYKDVQKTQNGRLWSIFIVSPILIIAGTMDKIPMLIKIFLVLSGISLIFTAGYAYIKTNKSNK